MTPLRRTRPPSRPRKGVRPLFFLCAFLLGANPVPPLSAEQSVLVRDGAIDGRDGVDAALPALLENLRLWPADADDRGVLLHPDWAKVLASPEIFRGMRMRVSGILLERTERPELGAEEWFIRDRDGAVVRAIVVAPSRRPLEQRVYLDGRFHKRLDAIARDGEEHTYPALVAIERGPAPRAAEPASVPPALLIAAMIAMIAVFLLLRRIIRRPDRERAGGGGGAASLDAGPPLPDDPADALAELRERHDP